MLKKQLSCILTSVVFSLLPSCTESFDIKTGDSPPVIVVYGSFTNEAAHHSIMISSSSPYFDKQPNQGIPGAEVRIESSAHDVFAFTENDTVPGLYQTIEEVAAIPGHSYTLTVEADFNRDGVKERYTATSFMQPSLDLDSIEIRHIDLMGRKQYAMYLYAQDPPEDDYYLATYKVNGTAVVDSISQLSVMTDKTFNGQYMNGMLLDMFGDAAAVDHNNENRNRVYLTLGDTVTLSLGHIEEGYYKFINQCRDGMEGESPFFGTPASNITTNISNGGVGYFTCYPVSTIKTVVHLQSHFP
ncbi:MAG: DUF4249 domain-containing protein [Tannerellaceae bacterium]|jgi:hypothetical protein|nr:DUF4249 domain-containing protein [Tannerellaceae bacterium]